MRFYHIKCPIHNQTFTVKSIRKWVEAVCEGRTLNLFSGGTVLEIDEVRNDIDRSVMAEYHYEALEFMNIAINSGMTFSTILLDPPYSYRKSIEYYNGNRNSKFKLIKDLIPKVLVKNGIVVTFGYHSVSMGTNRGFKLEGIAIFSHGGAIHDTIASVERFIK
jgi:hypothetical protein